jgi:hypothetical protein
MVRNRKSSPEKSPELTLEDRLQELTNTMATQNKLLSELRDLVNRHEETIKFIRDQLNIKEQYTRSWSVRVLHLPLPDDKMTDNRAVMLEAYDKVFRPILDGAAEEGVISDIPSVDALLKTAHVLPGSGGVKPIQVRFHSRYWRGLMFRHRRRHAAREPLSSRQSRTATSATTVETVEGRLKYPFYEDLTAANLKQLKEFSDHKDVESAWSVAGSIRFKFKKSPVVHKVSSMYKKPEDFLQ